MRSNTPIYLALALLLLAPISARAQLIPVVGGGATAFDPEIGVVNSGQVFDASAVVSQDRRYVTITAMPSSSNVIALRPFPVTAVSGANGFVGGADPGGRPAAPTPGQNATGGSPGNTPDETPVISININPTPAQRTDPLLLNRTGMIRLSLLR